jgi:Holliday junction resolvasome RuvABC endonuclease subunit
MRDAKRHLITLAIYFSTRGSSFVLFEGTLSPYDWGIFEVRGPRREAKCHRKVTQLLDRYEIDVLVIQDTGPEGTRRAARMTTLNAAVEAAAREHGVPVFKYSRADVYSSFASAGFSNKQTLAEVIANHIPAFERYVPPPRKPWKSEDARMALFDAAALALVFFQKAGTGQP